MEGPWLGSWCPPLAVTVQQSPLPMPLSPRRLWDRGLTLVATSNRHPDALYEGGLQRNLFLPFIARLKEQSVVHDMESRTDYRRLAHHSRRVSGGGAVASLGAVGCCGCCGHERRWCPARRARLAAGVGAACCTTGEGGALCGGHSGLCRVGSAPGRTTTWEVPLQSAPPPEWEAPLQIAGEGGGCAWGMALGTTAHLLTTCPALLNTIKNLKP